MLRAGLPAEEPEVVLERAYWRLAGLRAAVLLALFVMALRAGLLMLVPDERLQAKAAVQFRESVTVQGVRGEVLARDGAVLATTVDMPSLHADPSRIQPEDIDRLATELSGLLGTSRVRIEAKLRMSERQDVTLAPRISPDLLPAVRALAPRVVLWSRDVPTRYYPGRSLAAQVLGGRESEWAGARGAGAFIGPPPAWGHIRFHAAARQEGAGHLDFYRRAAACGSGRHGRSDLGPWHSAGGRGSLGWDC